MVRGADLTRLMVTLGIGLLTAEAANQASSITGGVDGLSDMQPATLFGTFSFGLDGTTAFLYSFVVLALMFALARRLVHSPFGLVAARDPRERAAHARDRRGRATGACGPSSRSRPRWPAWPARCWRRPPRFVGIDTLGFQRSAELLIILAFGGTGRLYGALLGAAVFIVAQDVLAGISPAYWQFWLGAVLVMLVLVAPGGLMGGLDRAAATALRAEGWGDGRRAEDGAAAAQLPGLRRRRRRVAGDSSRRAPRAHRPQRRRQDHAHQPAHRACCAPTRAR